MSLDKDFLKKGVILPLACAAGACVILTAGLSLNYEKLMPLSADSVISYYEDTELSEETADISQITSFDELEANTLIGTVGDVTIRYNAEYSALKTNASVVVNSALPSETGCMYLKTTSALSGNFDVNSFTFTSGDTRIEYRYVDEFNADNEEQVLATAPELEHAMIVYYQISNASGLSSNYRALIFEEVA